VNLRAYWRFVLVTWQFLPLALAYARDRRRFLLFGRSREVTAEQRRQRAAALLDSMLTLGPTFIKLGQLLSTRPDILPPEYVDEFTKLQDRVPPADWDDARVVLEDELGPVDEAFADFEREPISGASLGQVYRASVDGDPVAVKVRRPGVETLVEADLRVIRWTLPLVMRFVGQARSFSLETLADEFARTIRQEMDYRREARMLTEIRGNFADRDDVRMPTVVESHSTGRVLTMEYLAGTKVTDTEALDEAGHDRTALAETLQRTYLEMIIEDGVFHADPHPGNLAVAEDGSLIFYDFGMSGYVDAFVQEKIVEFYSAVARQDIDAILDALIEMGTLSPEADREVMGDVMELAIADARGEDIEHYRVQQIVGQVEDTIYEFPLRLPSNLALVLRVATVVEGVCVSLDPDFDFIDVATDFLRDEGYLTAGAREFVRERATEVRDAGESIVRVPPKLESALDTIERDELRVSADIEDSNNHFRNLSLRLIYGMTFAAGILSASVLFAFAPPVSAVVPAALSVVVLALLYRSFREGGGIRAQPQFTRHEMRQRDREEAAVGYGEFDTDEDDDGQRATEPTAEMDATSIPVADATESEEQGADESADDGR
jgi:predicted unusual protein kinase regulating ubiquinone biosynthesis (AarF/ABC1/UbiB family)